MENCTGHFSCSVQCIHQHFYSKIYRISYNLWSKPLGDSLTCFKLSKKLALSGSLNLFASENYVSAKIFELIVLLQI